MINIIIKGTDLGIHMSNIAAKKNIRPAIKPLLTINLIMVNVDIYRITGR